MNSYLMRTKWPGKQSVATPPGMDSSEFLDATGG